MDGLVQNEMAIRGSLGFRLLMDATREFRTLLEGQGYYRAERLPIKDLDGNRAPIGTVSDVEIFEWMLAQLD
jgi:hypothetical protein